MKSNYWSSAELHKNVKGVIKKNHRIKMKKREKVFLFSFDGQLVLH